MNEQISDAELNARFTKAYEAQHGRVIDVYAPSFRQKWSAAPFTHKLAAIFIVGAILPWAIIIGGIAILGLIDAIRR
jgi:hypothetical protein